VFDIYKGAMKIIFLAIKMFIHKTHLLGNIDSRLLGNNNINFVNKKLLALLIICLSFASPAFSAGPSAAYYASIKSDDANIRTGPSARYPIQWTYKHRNWPVQVTASFERWKKISDINGEIGWVHEVLLSNKRYGLIKTEGVQEVYRLPLNTSTKVFIVENGVVAELKECKNDWCKIKVEGHDGWLKSEHIWGVDKGEVIE